jgi:hypothetical protein
MRPPREVELRAGPLSATLVGPDLVDIRWGSLDVAERLQVTLRDADWGTVVPRVRSCSVETSADRFRVDMEAVHEDERIAFAWHGAIEGRADGGLTFAIDGVPERGFVYRRIGICVLHPWRSHVGCPYRATTPTAVVRGTFPLEIAPQPLSEGRYLPMIQAFTALHVGFGDGTVADFAFEGDLFELEDQRNWTDASFKTYPTPLARSEPRWLRPGERVVQRVGLRVDGPPPRRPPAEDVTTVEIGAPGGDRVPPIGLVAPGEPGFHPAHLRVEIDVTGGDVAQPGSETPSGGPLEVVLLVDDEARGIEALAPALAATRLARVLIHRRDGTTIRGGLVRSVAERLGRVLDGVQIVGGTWEHFSELNRHPPDGASVDAIAFSVSPTVHTTDQRSMVATLEIQPHVVGRARDLSGTRPIVVSPVRLGAHAGTPFADAWTVGSVAALAASASSLTYEIPTPGLSRAMQLREAEVLDVAVSHPDRIAVLATRGGTILANLTRRPQRLTIDGDEQPTMTAFEVRFR